MINGAKASCPLLVQVEWRARVVIALHPYQGADLVDREMAFDAGLGHWFPLFPSFQPLGQVLTPTLVLSARWSWSESYPQFLC